MPHTLYNILKELIDTKNSVNSLGKITISLSNDAEEKLRKRAERNLRSISKEVEFILLEAEKREETKT